MASCRVAIPRVLVVAALCLGRQAAADATGPVLPWERPTARAALARVAADSGSQATSEPAKTRDTTASKPFLKTRRGILLVSLVALAVGFTLYSTSNDRVQSPIR